MRDVNLTVDYQNGCAGATKVPDAVRLEQTQCELRAPVATEVESATRLMKLCRFESS
jgi:hypothetical protein